VRTDSCWLSCISFRLCFSWTLGGTDPSHGLRDNCLAHQIHTSRKGRGYDVIISENRHVPAGSAIGFKVIVNVWLLYCVDRVT
jgi:hypothetical protein